MKFGIFDYIDARGETLQKTYEDRLALLQAAETAGFYGYHLTEHHATPLSMTPPPRAKRGASASARCSISCRSTIRCGCWKNSACSTISAAAASTSAWGAASRPWSSTPTASS